MNLSPIFGVIITYISNENAMIITIMSVMVRILSSLFFDSGRVIFKDIMNRSFGFVLFHLYIPIVPMVMIKINMENSMGSSLIPKMV